MDFILDAVAEKVIVYPSSLDYGITSELIEKKLHLNCMLICGHISRRTDILSEKTLENPLFLTVLTVIIIMC